MIEGKDNIERSITPFHNFADGGFQPFGKKTADGEFVINYHATSRYGYEVLPIWAVKYKADGAWHEYKFFIGEAPHKDDNGTWVTYNEVPTFITGSFPGADYIDKEPDVPHIVRPITDEFDHYNKINKENAYDEVWTNYRKAQYNLEYCTFKDYLKGLHNRIKSNFGEFTKYKGERYKYIMFSRSTKRGYFGISLFKKLDGTETYFQNENDDWIYFLYLKKDGKLCFKYVKQVNDHVGCAC